VIKIEADLIIGESVMWQRKEITLSDLSDRIRKHYNDRIISITKRTILLFYLIFIQLLVSSPVLFLSLSSEKNWLVSQCIVFSGVLCGFGVWMTRSSKFHLPAEGLSQITLSSIFTLMAISIFLQKNFSENESNWDIIIGWPAIIVSLVAIQIAYVSRLRWILCLAWIYFLCGIGVLKLMPAVTAGGLAVVVLGYWHQTAEQGKFFRFRGFGNAMMIVGIIYLNCSLAAISIGWVPDEHRLVWSAILILFGILQIGLGLWLREQIIIGWGMIFFALNLITQFVLIFQGTLPISAYFFAAGITGIVFGLLVNRFYCRRSDETMKHQIQGA